MRKSLLLPTAIGIATFAIAGAAYAATHFGAAAQSGGSVTLTSNTADTDTTNDFSGISFSNANGLAFEDLTALSADTTTTAGGFGGGSPRFQIGIDTDGDSVRDGNIFVYLGTPPNFTDAALGTTVSSGNLIGSTDTRFDLTQLGGAFYSTYADALALLGSDTITGISLVVDGGWAVGGNQVIVVDNVNVNGEVNTFPPTPTSKDACKKGGRMSLTDADGNAFRNQGQCVSYFNQQ